VSLKQSLHFPSADAFTDLWAAAAEEAGETSCEEAGDEETAFQKGCETQLRR